MDTSEFAKLLYETRVPSSLSAEEKQKKYEPVLHCISEKTPERLYRYRHCDTRSFEAFHNNQVWVSTAESMNDGFDARLFFDKEEITQWLEQELPKTAKASFSRLMESVPKGAEMLPGMEQVYAAVKNTPENVLSDAIEGVLKMIMDDSLSALSILASIAQQTIKFCCLSEVIDSAVMWGLYAGDESGFTLAYDFKTNGLSVPAVKGKSRNCTLFPIIYGDERFKVPTEYIQYLLTYRIWQIALINSGYANYMPAVANAKLQSLVCPDMFMATKIALHKSREWEREAEWRLFCTSNDDMEFQNAKHGYIIKKPVAVYLGRRISPVYERLLKELAKDKNIPVYKMQLDDKSPTYKLHPIILQG